MSDTTQEKIQMAPKQIPQLSFQEWSDDWKAARKNLCNFDHMIDLWRSMPTTHRWTRNELVNVLGFRKNLKKLPVGEQKIEADLLGARNEVREHRFCYEGRDYQFKAIRHAVALSDQKTGQVIADALGIIVVHGKCHPVVIEIKDKADDCWSAVIQNMQQVRMLRANEKKNLRQLQADGGVWGMVLAPKRYFESKPHLEASKRLLEQLKICTDLRIALCYANNLAAQRVECFWSNWSV